MSNVQKGAERTPHDLAHFVMSAGKMGQLQTLSAVPVIAGDSVDQELVGSLRLSQLRRGLAVDSHVDVFTFYIPHRHIYGDAWVDLMKGGIDATPIDMVDSVGTLERLSFLAQNTPQLYGANPGFLPKMYYQGYLNIFNNYFKVPWEDDDQRTLQQAVDSGGDVDRYGFVCGHMNAIWNTPLPPETGTNKTFTADVSGVEATINIQDLNTAFAKLHTDQERDMFMQRYRDVMESFGGYANPDVDQRPKLLMHSEFWASGYDVDGTDQATLGQFSGRVQQSFKHKVPRFYVPEHGMVWTMALVRFPPLLSNEKHYLAAQPLVTYEDVAGDPTIVGNIPTKELNLYEIQYGPGGNNKFRMPHSQWYRTHPNTIHGNYSELQGFPFINNYIDNEDDMLRVRPADFDEMFQTTQLGHWNMQAKNNFTVLRSLPSARDSIMTS